VRQSDRLTGETTTFARLSSLTVSQLQCGLFNPSGAAKPIYPRRCESVAGTLSRMTGIELVAQEDDLLHLSLTLTQVIPRAMPGREQRAGAQDASQVSAGAAPSQDPASCDGVAEHVLVLELEAPGSAKLRCATLNPPAVDIETAVKAAREAQAAGGSTAAAALAGLVNDVKALIRKHCRRQLHVEGDLDAPRVLALVPVGWPWPVVKGVEKNAGGWAAVEAHGHTQLVDVMSAAGHRKRDTEVQQAVMLPRFGGRMAEVVFKYWPLPCPSATPRPPSRLSIAC
jgi:hypothetical protein